MRARVLAVVLLAAAACGSEPIVPVDATPDADLTDAADSVAPETEIDSAPPALTNVRAATFMFSATEPGATFRCSTDSSAAQPCTTPLTINNLADGPHTFEVYATDQADNRDLTPARHTWSIDTQPPDTLITDPPPNPDNSTTVSIPFESPGESNATFECSLNTSPFATCTSPFMGMGLVDGQQTFRVRARDAAGNADPTPAQAEWQVDTVSPDTVIDSGPAGTVSATTATFTFSSPNAGPNATFACRLDTAAFAPCVSPRSFPGLADGPHSFEVRVTNEIGSTDPSPARRNWTVDSTGPVTTITMRPENPSNDLTPSFAFTSEAGATFECRLDQAQFAPCASPFDAPQVTPGLHFFRVRAVDMVGNRGPEATHEWVIDSSGPVVNITSGPSGPVALTTVTFNWNTLEPATYCYRFTGDPADTCTAQLAGSGTVTRQGLAQGAQSFTITATDALGNAGAPAIRNFIVDTVGSVGNDFTFTSPEPATFCYRVDNGGEVCTLPPGAPTATVHVNATDGQHTLSVVARDALGNRTAMAATRTWTVDTIRPATTITSGPDQASVVDSADATVELAASESSEICWRVNGGAETCSAAGAMMFTADLMGLTPGPIQFSARSRDAIGFGPAVTRSWTVDVERPTVMITAGPAMGSTSGSKQATFTVASSEPSRICWTFNALPEQCSPAGVTSFSPSQAALPEGANTFTVHADDAIGDGPNASVTWTVDSVRPTVAITSGPAEGSAQGLTAATFGISASESAEICWRFNGGNLECSAAGVMMANAAAAGLPEGSNLLEVHARDAVGAGAIVQRSWLVDSSRPTITITAGPAQGSTVGSTAASFTVQSSERARICWSFNGGAATCSAAGVNGAIASITGLPQGPASFSVTGTDAVGAGVPATVNWTVDTIRPTVTINAGPTEGERVNAVAIQLTVGSSESSTICWRVDGGAESCSGAGVLSHDIQLMALTQGGHAVAVYARDAVGNGATLTRNFTVDTVRPTLAVTAGPADDATIGTDSVSYTLRANEPSTICWSFDGGAQSCSAAGVVQAIASRGGLAGGAHTLQATAADAGGPGVAVMRDFTVDLVRPTVTIDSGPAQGSTSGQTFAVFEVSASEPATFCWRFNNGPVACSLPNQADVTITSTPLATGLNVLSVEARDAIGVGTAVVRSWRVDLVRPTLVIDSGPLQGEVLDSNNAAIQLTASEPSTICWSFNGAMPATCSVPGQVTVVASAVGLPEGPATFTATASDGVGAGPPVMRSWVVDTLAPTITISAPPADGDRIKQVNTNFTLSTNEPATICWRLDGGAETCSAAGVMMFAANLVNVPEGNRTLSVRATDVAANENTTTRVWTVDLTAPTVTISAPPAQNAFTTATSAAFTLGSNEPATICWQLDGSMPVCSAPASVSLVVELAILPQGPHALAVTATDVATNVGNATRNWTVDTTAPTIGIVDPDGNITNDATLDFKLTSDEPATICWILDGGAETCSLTPVEEVQTGSLAIALNEQHTLAVSGTDRAGNVTNTSRMWTRSTKPSAPATMNDAATVYGGMATAWVRNPGWASGEIMSVRVDGGTCSLRGVGALVALECTVGGVRLAPAYGSLGSLAQPDGRWHLVAIAIADSRAELWIDGAFSDRTGASRAGLRAGVLAVGAGSGSYGLDTIGIRRN